MESYIDTYTLVVTVTVVMVVFKPVNMAHALNNFLYSCSVCMQLHLVVLVVRFKNERLLDYEIFTFGFLKLEKG